MATRRAFLGRAGAAAVLAASAGRAWAQGWPGKPIRMLVGFTAGGNLDTVARTLAAWLTDQLGQPVVVENRPGAGSNVATEAMIRSPADGYTLLLAGAVNAINASLYEKLGFEFARDVAPVAGVSRFPNVMTVAASFPARTVPEFIEYAKAHPGKINHGSSGNGTTQHLAGELFRRAAGVDLVHVPYKGASQAITDLLGGQVQVLFEALPPSLPFIRSGQLRPLAVTTASRAEVLPDVPAMREFAAGYEASGWTAVCAPRGTPPDVVAKLNAAINAGLADPKLRGRFADLGAATLVTTPAELAKLISDETEKWGQLVRAAGVRAA